MKAAAAALLCLLLTSCAERIIPTVVRSSPDEAVIDLSTWDFQQDGPVRLIGTTWELYWKELYTPGDFQTGRAGGAPTLVTGGTAWNGNTVAGETLAEDGYATYRAVVLLPEGGVYGLYMQNQDSAYRLWLNGSEAGGNGRVARTAQAYVPQRLPRVFHYHVAGDRLQIIMQVANFTHKWGGLTNNIYIGPSGQINGYVSRLYGIINFLCGAILIMAAYHLILYVINRKDLSALFFSLFCFFVLFWYLFDGEYLFFRLFPSVSLSLGIRLQYASMCSILPFFLLFIHSAYPDTLVRIPVRVLIGAAFGLSVVPLLTPVKFFSSHIFIPYYSLVLIGAVAVALIIIRALVRKHPGALFSLAGFAVFMGTVLYDILGERKIITGSAMGPFAPAGLFVFLLLHSFILARQFSAAYTRLDHLTDNLESEVRERTAALQQAREQAHQQEKLAALGTLAGGVSHEILNPLSGISGPLELVKREIGEAGLGNAPTLVRHLSYIEDNVGRITMAVKNLDALMKDRRITTTSVPLLPVVRRITEGYPEVHFSVAVEDRVSVAADAGILTQVMENLVSNAVAALDAGGRVSISYEDTPAPGRILVQDTGCGMGTEALARAFDPFYTTKTAAGGSGLGLFLARRLAASLGWVITLTSVPGEGTEVVVSLNAHPHRHE